MEDNECNNSCEDDTTSESESSVSMEIRHALKSHLKYFFVPSGRHSTRKLGMREPMGGGSGGGGGVTLILSVGEGGGGLTLIFA